MQRLTSRKFLGTVVLSVLLMVGANGWLTVPDEVVWLWATWMGVEGLRDAVEVAKKGGRRKSA